MRLQCGMSYKEDEYPKIYMHGCPKDLPVEIIDNPVGGNARDVKIGMTVVIFEKRRRGSNGRLN